MIINNNVENFPMLKQLDKFLQSNGAFVAGGVFKNIFNGQDFRDVDVFFDSAEAHQEALNHAVGMDYPKIYSNDKADCFRMFDKRVDLVKYKFGKPEEIINDFDFTITKFAYGFNHEALDGLDAFEAELLGNPVTEATPFVLHDEKFFEHLHMRRLVINGELPYPINTWERTYKYRDQGYQLCRDSKVTLLQQVMEKAGTGTDALSLELSRSLYNGID